MNRDRSRFTLLAVAGAYLAYTGGVLIKDVINERPDNMWLFALLGVAFIGIGVFVLYKNGKAIFQLRREEAEQAEKNQEGEESVEIEEGVEIEGGIEVEEGVEIEGSLEAEKCVEMEGNKNIEE